MEKRQLERLFEMGSGYVLHFSDRTYGEFVEEATGKDGNDQKYTAFGSGSKANRLRAFWKYEPNYLVGRLIGALIEHRLAVLKDQDPTSGALHRLRDEESAVAEARRIAQRLMSGSAVPDAEALIASEPELDAVAREVRDAINKNKPEAGLDRLHTFVVKFVRARCTKHGISVPRDKPLHSAFGEYVKALRNAGRLETAMTERILKSTISTLEAFNTVRNEHTLAHDNKLLNYAESLLILNHVVSAIRFLQTLEGEATPDNPPPTGNSLGDDIPF